MSPFIGISPFMSGILHLEIIRQRRGPGAWGRGCNPAERWRVYHKDMKPFWVLMGVATAAGFAQTTGTRPPAKKTATKAAPKKDAAPAPAPTKWPIESLRVEGNRNYTADQVLAVARLKVGEVAGKPAFDAARDRLVASGAFETVGYRFEPGA